MGGAAWPLCRRPAGARRAPRRRPARARMHARSLQALALRGHGAALLAAADPWCPRLQHAEQMQTKPGAGPQPKRTRSTAQSPKLCAMPVLRARLAPRLVALTHTRTSALGSHRCSALTCKEPPNRCGAALRSPPQHKLCCLQRRWPHLVQHVRVGPAAVHVGVVHHHERVHGRARVGRGPQGDQAAQRGHIAPAQQLPRAQGARKLADKAGRQLRAPQGRVSSPPSHR